jgi:hypothetical protein
MLNSLPNLLGELNIIDTNGRVACTPSLTGIQHFC